VNGQDLLFVDGLYRKYRSRGKFPQESFSN